ncbi:MAG: pyruvate dehydrogenase complex dihydrolipoamide acetyltransferase, partial [Sphingomonadaceae bacterium PASS1]
MSIELKMPALSPTMEEGTLAKWLVKEGDTVSSGDLIAEIETDKATMEFEAVDEGVITQLLVAEGTDGVKVGTVIAIIQDEADDATAAPKAAAPVAAQEPKPAIVAAAPAPAPVAAAAKSSSDDRVKASPLAKRIAAEKGIDLTLVTGTGPNGRIVKEDVEAFSGAGRSPAPSTAMDPGLRREAPAADSRPSTGSGLTVDGGN